MTTATPNAPATTKLSEAMRRGFRIAKGKHMKQVFGAWYKPGEGVCAAGAAFLAMAPDPDNLDEFFVYDIDLEPFEPNVSDADAGLLPANTEELRLQLGLRDRLERDSEDLPEDYRKAFPHFTGSVSIEDVVTTLNDKARWSIPKIADWLESIGR